MDNAVAGASDAAAVLQEPDLTTPAQPVQTTKTLLAYGALALPLCVAEMPILLYLPAFYAQELHLAAGLVGAVFLAARLWDGMSDVLIGWLSDRSMSRFGRRKPWVMVATPLLMVSTWFLCNPAKSDGLVYLGVWAGLFYTAWTAIKIPHQSWGTELATDYVERSRVAAFRETFTMLGNIFFVAAPLILLADDAPLHEILLLVSMTVVLLLPLTALPLGLWVRDPPPLKRTETQLLKGLAALAKDPVLIRFSLITLFIQTASSVTSSLAVFSLTVGLHLPNKLLWVIFILYATTLCVLPMTMRLAKSSEKHLLLAAGIAIQVVATASLVFAPLGNFSIVACIWVVVGLGSAAWLVLPPSILADVIDHGEVMTGERRSGAYVAIYNLVFKIGLALGVGLAFGLVALVDYDPAALHYSADDARNIRLLGFGLPALLLVPAIVLLLRYPITKKVQQQLRVTINSRNGVATAQ